MLALESLAKCLVLLTIPDGFYRFLKDVSQHSLLLILSGAFMTKGRKTTRQDITARGNVSQCVGTLTSRPGAITKIPYQALQRCGGTGRIENDTALFARFLTLAHEFQFFTSGSSEQCLFRVG